MIISLRRLHDLDRATPDELEGLRGRASKENEKTQTSGCGRELRVGSQVGSSNRGRTNSQSSQNSKTVLKMMIPIQQATDLNVIGGKLIESAEKEKLSIRRNFRNLDRANVEATGFVGLFGQDDNDQPKTLHVPNVKRSNSCLSGKIGKVNVRNQDFKRNSKIKENVEIEKENSELDPELQKVIDAAK